jgi:hypothetical protein
MTDIFVPGCSVWLDQQYEQEGGKKVKTIPSVPLYVAGKITRAEGGVLTVRLPYGEHEPKEVEVRPEALLLANTDGSTVEVNF